MFGGLIYYLHQDQNSYPAPPHGPGPGNTIAPTAGNNAMTGQPGPNVLAGNHSNAAYLNSQAAAALKQQQQYMQRQQLMAEQVRQQPEDQKRPPYSNTDDEWNTRGRSSHTCWTSPPPLWGETSRRSEVLQHIYTDIHSSSRTHREEKRITTIWVGGEPSEGCWMCVHVLQAGTNSFKCLNL